VAVAALSEALDGRRLCTVQRRQFGSTRSAIWSRPRWPARQAFLKFERL